MIISGKEENLEYLIIKLNYDLEFLNLANLQKYSCG
jgi:hypothetical protein